MDFEFNAEHEQFRAMVQRFARQHLAPRYAHWDATGEFPWEQVEKMGQQGILGLAIPEKYGGQGFDLIAAGIAAETIGGADFNCVWFLLHAVWFGRILGRYGTEEQRAYWLPRVSRGQAVSAIGVTEPDFGSDAGAMRMRAVKIEAGYELEGEKTSVSLGSDAQVAIVLAKTDPSQGARGVTAFLVPLDAPGVQRSRFDDLGNRGIGRSAIGFTGVRVPETARLGDEGQGFKIVMSELDCTRVLIALQCVGAAMASLDETMEYVKHRQAFGQSVAQFEGVSFPIAEYATYLEAVRLLCYKTLWLRAAGRPHTKESAMCKWWAPRLAVEVIHRCLLFHGHAGFSKELPLQQRLRDAIGLEIGDGTAEIQKIIIARELMGRGSLPYKPTGPAA